MRFFYLKIFAIPSMGDFREKKIPSGFPTLSQITLSGVRTICDLVEAVPSLFLVIHRYWGTFSLQKYNLQYYNTPWL